MNKLFLLLLLKKEKLLRSMNFNLVYDGQLLLIDSCY